MSQVLAARVTCPGCQNQFQTPIEQILDVRADPGAKARLLNGMLNIAVCPHCGMGGGLNLPFFYHDPDKELALVYMPMGAGQDNLERQQAIGQFTRGVMDSLPPEERKAYLLQPQVFFTLENLTNKIFEADGITPEMLEEQRAKANLLRRLIEIDSDEALEEAIRENDDAIDADFFQLLGANVEIVQLGGRASAVGQLLGLREKLLELSSEGRVIKAREEMLEALRDDPTREKLLELLVQTSDEVSRELLVVFGRPLLDYAFFQALTAQIESESDEVEKERLTALRKAVLDIRDRRDEEERELYAERSALLRDLLLSSDPENLARRRFAELDQIFFDVLTAQLQEARTAGNEEAVESLQAIWVLVMKLAEETLPPEVRLFNRLLGTEDEAEVDKLLQENRSLVTDRLIRLIERMAASLQERGDTPPEVAERLALVLEKAQAMLTGSGAG